MEIEERILLTIEDIDKIPSLDGDVSLKSMTRDTAILHGLLIANYTQEDNIFAQLNSLKLANKEKIQILNKFVNKQYVSDANYILFIPQTGLELLKYSFSIPKAEFNSASKQQDSLLTTILKINSQLLANNSRLGDKSLTLFTKQIKFRKYELDDRFYIYPTIYRMWCLLHFFEEDKRDFWVELKKALIKDLNVRSFEEYFSNIIYILEHITIGPKTKFTILGTEKVSESLYALLKFLSFEVDSFISSEENRDYTYFKRYPIIQLSPTKFGVINNTFLANQLYTSLKFRMSRLCENFFSVFNNDFVEKYLLNEILRYAFLHDNYNVTYLTENDCKSIISKYIENNRVKKLPRLENLPDAYIRQNSKILLIECKGKTISLNALENPQKCIEDINNDLVNEKHGTGQLISNCERIIGGNFIGDSNLPADYVIYPLLVVDDFVFSANGFNRYVIKETQEFVGANSPKVYSFTVLDMDTLILVAELIRQGDFDIFKEIEEYHNYIEGKQNYYTIGETFYYSDVSFSAYIIDKYETYSPKIIEEWSNEYNQHKRS